MQKSPQHKSREKCRNHKETDELLVSDEADELLSQDDFKQGDIIKDMREDRQVLLFSSTWPTEVERLSQTVLKRDYFHGGFTLWTGDRQYLR